MEAAEPAATASAPEVSMDLVEAEYATVEHAKDASTHREESADMAKFMDAAPAPTQHVVTKTDLAGNQTRASMGSIEGDVKSAAKSKAVMAASAMDLVPQELSPEVLAMLRTSW